jgi:hypothetical protein
MVVVDLVVSMASLSVSDRNNNNMCRDTKSATEESKLVCPQTEERD